MFVLRYLKETIILGIKWGNDLAEHYLDEEYRAMRMVKYANNSYANDLEDKMSIIKYYSFFDGAIVTW